MKAMLKDGYETEIRDDVANDWRFLTVLRKIDKGDTGMIVDAAEILLGGEEEVERLAKHLEVDGITPVDAMIEAIQELMESTNELKNSEPSPA
jgi:hypothetical protein